MPRDPGGDVETGDYLTLNAWLEHWLGKVLPMTARWTTLSAYRRRLTCLRSHGAHTGGADLGRR